MRGADVANEGSSPGYAPTTRTQKAHLYSFIRPQGKMTRTLRLVKPSQRYGTKVSSTRNKVELMVQRARPGLKPY